MKRENKKNLIGPGTDIIKTKTELEEIRISPGRGRQV